MRRQTLVGLSVAALVFTACSGAGGPSSRGTQESDASAKPTAEDVVQLPGNASADITVERLARERYARTVEAPGEVALNAYQSAQVAPRIAAQVLTRQARLGDVVKENQVLVTLSSIEVAKAQGALVKAAREWSRLRSLGKGVVGEKRYVEARVAYRNARATLASYGLTEAQIDGLESESDTGARGRFDLVAPLAGTVLGDDFVTGEYVNAGRVLFLIADMTTLWVEAEVGPAVARTVSIGSEARIATDNVEQTGRVIQKQPSAQDSTRTVGIRIEVPRDADQPLYPSDFVTATLHTGMSAPVLAVPEGALVTLPDDAWAVFVRVGPNKFRQQKVRLGDRLANATVIEGIEPATEVVTQGAFYLASELGKASLGDKD